MKIMKDYYYDDEKHHFESLVVLKEAAFELLLLHPGIDKEGFIKILIEQYESEVVDVYGDNTDEVGELWNFLYFDNNSGKECTFKEWAMMFRTQAAVDEYYARIKPRE